MIHISTTIVNVCGHITTLIPIASGFLDLANVVVLDIKEKHGYMFEMKIFIYTVQIE